MIATEVLEVFKLKCNRFLTRSSTDKYMIMQWSHALDVHTIDDDVLAHCSVTYELERIVDEARSSTTTMQLRNNIWLAARACALWWFENMMRTAARTCIQVWFARSDGFYVWRSMHCWCSKWRFIYLTLEVLLMFEARRMTDVWQTCFCFTTCDNHVLLGHNVWQSWFTRSRRVTIMFY